MSSGLHHQIKIFTGTSHPVLTQQIAEYIGIPLGQAEVGRFSDGEISVKIHENIRGWDIFVVQPTHPNSDNLMELLILLDACRRASARRITAVIPYFGYARQDRKDESRVPITAKLVANLITAAGTYTCAACGAELFASDKKFDAHCGWPSFYDAKPGAVVMTPDDSLGMVRTEVTCATCGGHLGHVFEGEGLGTPTDQRYCINSLSLKFTPDTPLTFSTGC